MSVRAGAGVRLALVALACILLLLTISPVGSVSATPRATMALAEAGSEPGTRSGVLPSLQPVGNPVFVGTSSSAIAVDPWNEMVYVANSNTDNITVVSATKPALIATLSTGLSPVALLIDPQNGGVLVSLNDNYFTSPGNGSVMMFYTGSNTFLGSVVVGVDPVAMAFSPASGELFVANELSDTVSVILVSQARLLATLPLPSLALVADPSNGIVYSAGGGGDWNVSMIDSRTNTIVGNISCGAVCGGGPGFMTLDPWNGDLYVILYDAPKVAVISTLTNQLLGVVPVPNRANLLMVDSVNGDVIVGTNEFSNQAQFYGGNLTVISETTNRAIQNITVNAYYYGLVADNDTGALYLLTYETLTVFNATTVTPLYSDAVNASAYLIAVNPPVNLLYIVNPSYVIGVPGTIDAYSTPLPMAPPSSPSGLFGWTTLWIPVVVASVAVGAVVGGLHWVRSKRRPG